MGFVLVVLVLKTDVLKITFTFKLMGEEAGNLPLFDSFKLQLFLLNPV